MTVGTFDPYSAPARAINVALRTAHLGAMAAVSGGLAYGVPAASLRWSAIATVATGAALLVSEMTHSRGWLAEGRGIAAIAHVAAIGVLAASGRPAAGAAVALVLGAVGSHLPRSIRRFSLRRGGGAGGDGGGDEQERDARRLGG